MTPELQSFLHLLHSFLETSRAPLIVVLGATGSGKTDFSLDLAQAIQSGEGELHTAEIINADSRQLYRLLDIGTAKIPMQERRGIPHHLFDILDPREEATAAWYKAQATAVIEELQRRHVVPILVGGSMLYISALIDNLQFPEKSDPALRKSLSDRYDEDNGLQLFKELQKRDPETAQTIDRKNKPYVLRALELCEIYGSASGSRSKRESPYDLFIIGTRRTRNDLIARINVRTTRQWSGGWVEEVRSLLDRGYSPQDPGMKSQGYREIARALEEGHGQILDEAMLQASIATKARQYAKRQMTWWCNDERIHWIDFSE